jgi:hypothetical protein
MTIKTYSAFTYGHTVTDDNKFINFNEGSGELLAELDIGSYTLDAYKDEIARAMNDVIGSTVTYTVTLDRSTRRLTINGDASFDLLVSSGSNLGADAFSLMGFTGADLTGLSSYEGDSASGFYFEPQFMLQNYVDFEDNIKTTAASVNESASGNVEVVSYGTVNYMECNITLQTNIAQAEGSYLKNDPQGYDNLRAFLKYLITKAPVEFIPDIDTPTNFKDCLLESSKDASNGVNIKIKELYTKGFAEYYESGLLTFRELK